MTTDFFDRPAINPTTDSLRKHFSGYAADYRPAPINNPDSLSFIGRHNRINRHAAVLIPVFTEGNCLEVLLTRRADHLRDHAGQISFPGGGIEEADESFIAAALREAEEEVDLPQDKVEILGSLGEYYTVTGYCVVPVIGLIHEAVELTPDPGEVAEILRIPLNHLLDPSGYRREERVYDNIPRTFYSTYYQSHRIWGVTAGILMGLHDALTGNSDQ